MEDIIGIYIYGIYIGIYGIYNMEYIWNYILHIYGIYNKMEYIREYII
jgi:hypothetical protein